MHRSLVGALLVLAGCGTRPPEPPPSSSIAAVRSPADRARDDHEAQLRRDADGADHEHRWRDAALAWELLAILRPADPAVAARLAESRARVQAALADQQERAEQAVRRGDPETAAQAWWAMLGLDPANEPAAAALRQLEVDRIRKAYLGRHAGSTLTRRAIAESEAMPPAVGAPGNGSVGSSADLDRALVLADDGEWGAATEWLEERIAANRRDTGARRLLIDVYRREAEAFASFDPVRSRSALEKSARLEARSTAKAVRSRATAAGTSRPVAAAPPAAVSAASAPVSRLAGRPGAPM